MTRKERWEMHTNIEQMKPHGAVEWEDIINIDAKEGCKSVVASSDKLGRSTQGGKFLVQLND